MKTTPAWIVFACAIFFGVSASTVLGNPTPSTYQRVFLDGNGRTITAAFVGPDGVAFTIDPGTIRLVLSSLDHPGLTVGIHGAPRGLRTAHIPVPNSPLLSRLGYFPSAFWATLQFAVPSSLASGMYQVAFERDGKPLNGGDIGLGVSVVYIPGEDPDRGLMMTRRAYLGKIVFWVPQFVIIGETGCDRPVRSAPDFPDDGVPLRVISVRRIKHVAEMGKFYKPDADFLALDPLIIEFVLAQPKPNSCETYSGTFADPWEMQRHFLLRSPLDHPEWPAKFRVAVRQHTVLPGMTHEMVAAAVGYPSTYGTTADLDRLTRWNYDASTPFQASVSFVGDHVVRYDPPGNLP